MLCMVGNVEAYLEILVQQLLCLKFNCFSAKNINFAKLKGVTIYLAFFRTFALE